MNFLWSKVWMCENSSGPSSLLLQQHWVFFLTSVVFSVCSENCHKRQTQTDTKTRRCERREKRRLRKTSVARPGRAAEEGWWRDSKVCLSDGPSEEQQHEDHCTQSGNVSHQRSTDWRFQIVVFSCSQSVTQQAIWDDGSPCCFCRKIL